LTVATPPSMEITRPSELSFADIVIFVSRYVFHRPRAGQLVRFRT
jgi:hypothetical protein